MSGFLLSRLDKNQIRVIFSRFLETGWQAGMVICIFIYVLEQQNISFIAIPSTEPRRLKPVSIGMSLVKWSNR